MEAVDLLLARASVSPARLGEPAPRGEALDRILEAATRAPDHGRLRPWRFLVVRGEARERLGEVFADALRKRDPEAPGPLIEKELARPLRAPLVIAVVAQVKDHPKIPEIEQVLSTGAAAYALLLSAQAQGFGGMWVTGANAYDENVHRALGLAARHRIVGFVHLGTPRGDPLPVRRPDPTQFIEEWTGPADSARAAE